MKIWIRIRIKMKILDPDPHQSENFDPDRIRIKMMRTGSNVYRRYHVRYPTYSGTYMITFLPGVLPHMEF